MDKYLEASKRLINFLDTNPSPFHVIAALGKMYEKLIAIHQHLRLRQMLRLLLRKILLN